MIRAHDVGVIALDMYFPSFLVEQSDLEKFDGVSPGKYTVGLQQHLMAVPSDAEDINSICLTVVHSLIEKFEICEKDVGFLMVGTETIIDEMKSVKTVLMQLFAKHGNTDIQGSDTKNACYGGTAALFHAVDWVESSNWDGRAAIVVIADIALYDKGPARPTCGAGAIAMLIGPNAPLVIESGLRATHMSHKYDFYKPQLHSEYPFVDGKTSIDCYFEALDNCYKLFKEKYTKKHSLNRFDLAHFDGLLFHSPYCKIVSKAVARLFLDDHLENKTFFSELNNNNFEERKLNLEKKFNDKEVENYFLKISKQIYKLKSEPGLALITDIGNMYTASLYCCLISHILNKSPDQLKNTRILMYGHGGGVAATMFSIRVNNDNGCLEKMISKIEYIPHKLKTRIKLSAEQFVQVLDHREKIHKSVPFKPETGEHFHFDKTYILTLIDEKYRRFYKRVNTKGVLGN